MCKNCAVILAAGDGKRMKSKAPKVLNEVLFEPMLKWVMDSCRKAGADDICVVAGYNHEMVTDYVKDSAKIALQLERKGTAHAVMQARDFIANCDGNVLIACGDAPFMDEKTISDALKLHTEKNNDVTVITAIVSDATGYGRIVRTENGISGIVEHKDANKEQLEIKEINSGTYWFKASTLANILDSFDCNNSQGEYYLTDSIEIILKSGGRADAYASLSPEVALGANSKRGLYELHEIAKTKVIDKHFENGVEFLSLDGVIIGKDVTIEKGTKIYAGTILKGNTSIGEDCVIGPNVILDNVKVSSGCVLNNVQGKNTAVNKSTEIKPYSVIK